MEHTLDLWGQTVDLVNAARDRGDITDANPVHAMLGPWHLLINTTRHDLQMHGVEVPAQSAVAFHHGMRVGLISAGRADFCQSSSATADSLSAAIAAKTEELRRVA